MVAKGLEGVFGTWRWAKLWGSRMYSVTEYSELKGINKDHRVQLLHEWPIHVLGSVSDFSVCQMEEPHFLKSDRVCGVKILVWVGRTAGEQRIDPSQPHLKPVMQPKDSGGLADMVLKLLLKYLPAQPCVKKCRLGFQPVPLISLHLPGTPEQREKEYGKQKLPGPSTVWGGALLASPLLPSCSVVDGFPLPAYTVLWSWVNSSQHPIPTVYSFLFWNVSISASASCVWVDDGPEFGNEGLNILREGCDRGYIFGLASVEHLGTLHPPGRVTVNQCVLYTRGVAVLALFHGVIISSGVKLLGS